MIDLSKYVGKTCLVKMRHYDYEPVIVTVSFERDEDGVFWNGQTGFYNYDLTPLDKSNENFRYTSSYTIEGRKDIEILHVEDIVHIEEIK